MKPNGVGQKRAGFTLVEILVVMAIITLLAAVLLPVFAKVRERGRQIACLSNLRQLGLATFQYAQDSDDRYPYGGDPGDLYTDGWRYSENGKYWPAIQLMQANEQIIPNVMDGYVKNRDLWHCPSDNGFDMAGQHENIPLVASPSAFQAFRMSYAYTTQLALEGQTLSSVRTWSHSPPYSEHGPADVPLFYDLVGHWHGGTKQYEEHLNFVMLDGHAVSVNRVRADQLNNILFSIPSPSDPQWNASRPNGTMVPPKL